MRCLLFTRAPSLLCSAAVRDEQENRKGILSFSETPHSVYLKTHQHQPSEDVQEMPLLRETAVPAHISSDWEQPPVSLFLPSAAGPLFCHTAARVFVLTEVRPWLQDSRWYTTLSWICPWKGFKKSLLHEISAIKLRSEEYGELLLT